MHSAQVLVFVNLGALPLIDGYVHFGLVFGEVLGVAQRLMDDDNLDFLDMSLWDVQKTPEDSSFNKGTLLQYFAELDRGNTRLGVAGNIRTPQDAELAMAGGVDWVMLGKAAILHHDFPLRFQQDPTFAPESLPVTSEYLKTEGVSEKFIAYLKSWTQIVVD